MSFPPAPGRLLKKNSRCPSMDNAGPFSMKVVLMIGPRLTGGSQSHSRQARWETQMSGSPLRSDWKYRLSSSGESVAWASAAPVLIAARFTGVDHSELAKDMASSLIATGADSDSHATRSVKETSDTSLAMDTGFMGPPR